MTTHDLPDANAIEKFKQLLFNTEDERNLLLALEIAKAESFRYFGLREDLFEVWKQEHISTETARQIEQIIDSKSALKKFRYVVQQALQEEQKIAWEVGSLAMGLLRDYLGEEAMQQMVDKYQYEKRKVFATHEPLAGVELIYLYWLEKMEDSENTRLPKNLTNLEKLIRK